MNGRSRSRGVGYRVLLYKSARGVSVIMVAERRESRFPLTRNHCRLYVLPPKHLSLPRGTSIVAVVWFAVEPCPNLACRSTLRKTRREVVASRESNLGYPKPSFSVNDKGSLAWGNFAASLSCILVKKGSLILFFFTSYEENTKCKNKEDTSYRSWTTVIPFSSLRSTKDAFHNSYRLQAKDALQSLWAGPVPSLVWFAQAASVCVSSGGEPIL